MNNLKDSYKAKGLRRQLVKEIERKGIKSEAVLSAIGKMPRHVFFDSIFLEHAYEDKAFPIGEKQTISQPYTVAFQTELLNVSKGNKILEIGTSPQNRISRLKRLLSSKDIVRILESHNSLTGLIIENLKVELDFVEEQSV